MVPHLLPTQGEFILVPDTPMLKRKMMLTRAATSLLPGGY